MPLTVATWNVNGIRARGDEVREWLASARPDAFFLQELKARPDQVPEALAAGLGDYWLAWHGFGPYSGVAMGLRRETFPREPRFFHPDFDQDCRVVAAETEGLLLASLYVPNGGRDFPGKLEFLERLRDWAAELRADGGPALLAGDFNVAREERDIHPKERKPNQVGARPEERALLAAVLGEGLVDVGRALDPDNDELFTWWAPWRNLRQRNIGWRIDYLMASEALAVKAAAATVHRELGSSDHAPLVARFET
jgi:exodeoxyribonuclease-3